MRRQPAFVGLVVVATLALVIALLSVPVFDQPGGSSANSAAAYDRSQHARTGHCPVAQDPTIERNGELAGTLIVRPRCARPGEELAVSARNSGRRTMEHGACAGVQRHTRSGWRDASEEVFGGPPVCIALLVVTEPGSSSSLSPIRLPRDIRPGLFRAVHTVYTSIRGQRHGLLLDAIFRVLPPR
jgi:hypothetical protein